MNSTTTPSSFANEEGESIDIKKWLFRIVSMWPWFIVSIFVFFTAAKLYLRYTEPTYRSTSSILIQDERRGGSGNLDNEVLKQLNAGGSGKSMDNEMEVLKSPDLMKDVVRQEQLYVLIKHIGRIKDLTKFRLQIPVLIEVANPDTIDKTISLHVFKKGYEWLFSTIKGEEIKMQFGAWYQQGNVRFRFFPNANFDQKTAAGEDNQQDYTISLKNMDITASEYTGLLKVDASTNESASILILTLDDKNEVKAKTILNTLISIYNDNGLQDKNRVTAKLMVFLNERLNVVKSELERVENQVEQYKTQHKITDISGVSKQYLEMATAVDAQKASQQTQVTILSNLKNELVENNDNPLPASSTINIGDPSLSPLVTTYNNLLLEKAGWQNKQVN